MKFTPQDEQEALVIPVTYRKVVRDETKKYVEECICEVGEMEGDRPVWLVTGEFVITATVYKGMGKDDTSYVAYQQFKDANMSSFVSAAYGAIHVRDSYDAMN